MWMSHPSVPGALKSVTDSAFFGGWDTVGWVVAAAPVGPPVPDAGWPISRGELDVAVAEQVAVAGVSPAAAAGLIAAERVTERALQSSTFVSRTEGAYTVLTTAGILATSLTTLRGTPAYGTPAKFGNSVSGGVPQSLARIPEPAAGTTITVECWAYRASIGTLCVTVTLGDNLWMAGDVTTGNARFCFNGASATSMTGPNICDGVWHHLAMEVGRSAGVTTKVGAWVDGVPVSGSATTSAKAWVPDVNIGGLTASATYDWPGRMDDVRISAGSRYAGTFTPPTSALVADANTLLLASLDSSAASYWGATGYQPRPSDAPNGSVTYVGPTQPTTWLTNDRWVQTV